MHLLYKPDLKERFLSACLPDRSGEPERNYPQGLPLRVTLETDDLRFVGLYSSGIQRLRLRGDCLRPPELPAAFAESVLASALRL